MRMRPRVRPSTTGSQCGHGASPDAQAARSYARESARARSHRLLAPNRERLPEINGSAQPRRASRSRRRHRRPGRGMAATAFSSPGRGCPRPSRVVDALTCSSASGGYGAVDDVGGVCHMLGPVPPGQVFRQHLSSFGVGWGFLRDRRGGWRESRGPAELERHIQQSGFCADSG